MHDFVGIGLGPFNLGLACLTDPIDELDGVFLEARDELAWHPGMLLDDATLQVPFLADLVTMADPSSRYSFLSYLKDTGNLYPFYIRESFYPLRREYDDYCRWAADRLDSVRFGQAVTSVEHVADCKGVGVRRHHRDRRGVPRPAAGARHRHVAVRAGVRWRAWASTRRDYLPHKERLQELDSITIVGSGQSAAEIYQDLLAESPDHGYRLTWLTRSPRFFPMEYTKLTLEMTSPEYTSYFHDLPDLTRARLLREQRSLYKGISGDLVDDIFDLHYQLRVNGDGPHTTLVTNTAVTGARRDGAAYQLDLHHEETDETVRAAHRGAGARDRLPRRRCRTSSTRSATGSRWDDQGRYAVSPTYAVDHDGREIFVQNAEEHTHGLVAPDLGMGAYRNSVLIAAMLGREVYPVEKRIAVQSFGVPDHLKEVAR